MLDEQELMKHCIENTNDYEDAIDLFKAYQFFYYNQITKTVIVADHFIEDLDFELLEFVIKSIAKSNLIVKTFKYMNIKNSLKDFMEWFTKFFYYLEAKGDIQEKSIEEVFTSSYIPEAIEFNLEEIKVKNIIEVIFI